MRTLLPGTRSSADSTSAPLRRTAGRVVAVGLAVVVLAAAASREPGVTGRWASRAIIRARGGIFVSSPGAVLQSGSTDCGPAALATLIRTLGGDPPPTDSIARLAGTGASGTSFGGLSRAARRLGLRSTVGRLDAAAMEALSTPVIAWVDGGHFVTVVPDTSGFALVLDPQAGPYRIGRSRLARYWGGEALVPRPDLPAADSPNLTTGGLP